MKLISIKIIIFYLVLIGFFNSFNDCLGNELTHLKKNIFLKNYLGTRAYLIFYTTNRSKANHLVSKIDHLVEQLNNIFSDYKTNSELSLLTKSAYQKHKKMSTHLFQVISWARILSQYSNGHFDITIGNYTKTWRKIRNNLNDSTNILNSFSNEIKMSYKDYLLNKNNQTIYLKEKIFFDLGGIAKGYIVDQIIDLFKKNNINNALVNIGGEIACMGIDLEKYPSAKNQKKGWNIKLTLEKNKIINHIVLFNQSLSTSGSTYQYITMSNEEKKYSHIFNAKQKKWVLKSPRSVFVLLPLNGFSSMYVDSISTMSYIARKNKSQIIMTKIKKRLEKIKKDLPIEQQHSLIFLKKIGILFVNHNKQINFLKIGDFPFSIQ